MKICHLLYQSYPNISGSSVRSKQIVEHQKKQGVEVYVISSPYQPGISNSKLEKIDGVKYYRTFNIFSAKTPVSEKKKSIFVRLSKALFFLPFLFAIYKINIKEKPDIIHAHGNFYTGLAGLIISKIHSKKFIYEVRSLWEERAKINGILDKIQKIFFKKIERYVISSAEKVVTINNGLKSFLTQNYSISKDKIIIAKNGIDLVWTDSMEILPYNKNKLTFGYIRSISHIEGLEIILHIFRTKKFENYSFYIFGDGPTDYIDSLKKIAPNNVIFKGKINRNQINEAYTEIDVIVNPRKSSLITNTVTPLKSIEAAALGKIVVVSDLPPLKELIVNGLTGFHFQAEDKEDLEELLLKIIQLYSPKNKYLEFTSRSKDYIRSNFDWNQIVKCYNEAYF